MSLVLPREGLGREALAGRRGLEDTRVPRKQCACSEPAGLGHGLALPSDRSSSPWGSI